MQTTDQVIDEILLKSPYGAKAYEERQNRLRQKETTTNNEDEIVDHPKQMYFNFKEENSYE